jgi:anti-sigma regulatory factor (Ser/Thr protein kinase)
VARQPPAKKKVSMILKVSLDLPSDGTYMRIARRIGHTLLDDLGVVDRDIADIEFIVGELCTNVVRHAQTAGDSRFLVVLEYHADRVAIIVEDKGVGFSIQSVRDVGAVRLDQDGSERVGGFGLQLVRQMADHITFESSDSHGTKVFAEKALHYKTCADASDAEELDGANGGEVWVTSGDAEEAGASPAG